MMSFAIFDKNCSFVDNKNLKYVFANEGIPFAEQEGDKNLEEYIPVQGGDLCVYVMNMYDAGLSYQGKFVRDTKSIKQFLVILVDNQYSNEHIRKIAVSNFRAKTQGCKKDIIVICGAPDDLGEKLTKALLDLKQMRSNTVLITSAGSFVGKKTAAKLLGNFYPDKNFEICSPAELPAKSDHARHLIIIGTEPKDFRIPYIENMQSQVTLLFNKIDENPSCMISFDSVRKSITGTMQSSGWIFSNDFKAIYPSCLLYEACYQELKSNTYSFETLVKNNSFFMWDKYGLPCLAEEYTEKNIKRFIESICILDSIFEK